MSMRCSKVVILITFLWCYQLVKTDDYHPYKKCNESSFCKRLREYKSDNNPFQLLTLNNYNESFLEVLEGIIVNSVTQDKYVFSVQFLTNSTVRMMLKEDKVYRQRFQPNIVLAKEPALQKFRVIESTEEHLIAESDTNLIKLIATPSKLSVELYTGNDKSEPAIVVNDLNRLVMEYNLEEKGSTKYEETFDGYVDTRPHGPMAVGVDFSFPKARNLYGLFEHLENLALRSTRNREPYRLYNVDTADHVVHDGRSMYGSVPLIIAHGLKETVGVFWHNSAETWVDIDKLHEISTAGMSAYFMSETGVLDMFLLLGPSFHDVTKQYTILTGTAPLPPYFSLGYHQSRWNYFSQNEVLEVVENFDKYNLPLDVMWLDIEYTDQKKYFTWNPVNFSNPTQMIETLSSKGRKLVVIIDPHIKKDPEYKLYKDGIEKGYFVRFRNESTFIGNCWPGESAYLDFVNPAVRDYLASQYLLENFKGTTEDVFIWNDMNEPSIFDSVEKTLPKDALHHGGWEHRDIHNIYGFLHVTATYEGLLRRSNYQKRPFILSRSFFAGSQRYTAIWTGDNTAKWEHLKMSIPMCLTSALCGISFCGADVGGFFEHPEPELLLRWYQLGAFLPFFREHSYIETPRREPYLFLNTTIGSHIRDALLVRQTFLPFWYTLFYEHSVSGLPVIRPIVMEFPNELETFDIDYEFLVGDAILVRAVTDPNLSEVNVYLPGQEEIWYLQNHDGLLIPATKHGIQSVHFGYDTIPVFIRGGRIIPKSVKEASTNFASAKQVLDSNIGLYVAPNKADKATGYLYIDDGESFAYKNNNYTYLKFEYDTNTIRMRFVQNGFPAKQQIAEILITSEKKVQNAFALINGSKVQLRSHSSSSGLLIQPVESQNGLPLTSEWEITLE